MMIEASGATPNKGHSLGIRMKLEPEGARHSQERVTERLTGHPRPLRGRLISGAARIHITDHPKGPLGYRFPQNLPFVMKERQPEEVSKHVLQCLRFFNSFFNLEYIIPGLYCMY